MPVQAVFGDVKLAANEPFYLWLIKIPLQHFIPLFLPGKFFGNTGPELFGVFYAFFVN